MTILRVRPADWGIGEKLTSSEMNGVDSNASYALDKRLGETDTLESVVSCANGGRILVAQGLGGDADATYAIGDGNSLIYVPALTADREYTLSNTGAVQGDTVSVFIDPTIATYGVLVRDASSNPLFLVGNASGADGQHATFVFLSGAWHLFQGARARFRTELWTTPGAFNWTVPRGVTSVRAMLVGGGGGGGGGYGGGANCTGGGGGGGALLLDVNLTVTPGAVIAGSVATGGAAGNGGTIGNYGTSGTAGGDSTFGSLTAYGANGGFRGELGGSSTYAPPGLPRRGTGNFSPNGISTLYDNSFIPGQGGWARGTVNGYASPHAAGQAGSLGGNGGIGGSSPGGYAGGGGGGGGGGSGWANGNGGAGGNGASGNSGGVASSPVAGSPGTLGGGGGGGGAGGSGSAGSSAGASGGAGGNGAVMIIYVK